MILQTILEGLGLGALLVLVCAVGIRKFRTAWRINSFHHFPKNFKGSYFEFGSIEDHFKYRQAVMKAYPYNDLKDPSVSGFFRFLAKVGDGMMKMQIVKIRFGGGK